MNYSVLVCDDSNLARKQVLKSLPTTLSSNSHIATNGVEALAILRCQNIDVLLLDLTMPVLDGIGVLEGIRQDNIQVTVFVISADIQPEMQSKVLALGAKAFLQKPINAELLHENLTQCGFI